MVKLRTFRGPGLFLWPAMIHSLNRDWSIRNRMIGKRISNINKWLETVRIRIMSNARFLNTVRSSPDNQTPNYYALHTKAPNYCRCNIALGTTQAIGWSGSVPLRVQLRGRGNGQASRYQGEGPALYGWYGAVVTQAVIVRVRTLWRRVLGGGGVGQGEHPKP